MITSVDLILVPSELERLSSGDLRDTACVVFDVLRATSTMVTALHHGAEKIIVVGEIEEALALREANRELLLAGERGGKRISASLTGSVDFDLGNSPREFTREAVARRSIVLTTTNGTRALGSCRGAALVLAASFLNLGATAQALIQSPPRRLMLVCAGTGDNASYEDTLGAGALLSLLSSPAFDTSADACRMAIQLHESIHHDLETALRESVNGRRLAADPDLHGDLAFCARRDIHSNPVHIVGNLARLGST